MHRSFYLSTSSISFTLHSNGECSLLSLGAIFGVGHANIISWGTILCHRCIFTLVFFSVRAVTVMQRCGVLNVTVMQRWCAYEWVYLMPINDYSGGRPYFLSSTQLADLHLNLVCFLVREKFIVSNIPINNSTMSLNEQTGKDRDLFWMCDTWSFQVSELLTITPPNFVPDTVSTLTTLAVIIILGGAQWLWKVLHGSFYLHLDGVNQSLVKAFYVVMNIHSQFSMKEFGSLHWITNAK